ncbi:MAG TPA: HIT family protein [Rhodocyclaceae bacterium]|nr:MAG: HIT family protein [Rhodocyclales bacterium CG_4_10_14_3_um_filter_68_10]HCX33528.1 HIT family protein [Rhodocyclaceae bacterium]
MTTDSCDLCGSEGGEPIWRDARLRIVRVADPDYPAYCRVIWNGHVREMTDLCPADRTHLMNVVFAVEAALRCLAGVEKINLASFGNLTPHVHWHVVARTPGDRHFPEPLWGAARARGAPVRIEVSVELLKQTVRRALARLPKE